MSNDLGDWYRSIPRISRFWFTASIVFPLLGKIGLINPMWVMLFWEHFAYKFQIWRPVTALFYYPLMPQTGFHYLINLYFLYSYSTALETGKFDGRPAEYVFLLLFNWLCLVIIGFVAELYVLMDPMILSIVYVWCRLNPEEIVEFWFGMQFQAIYLPWVIAAFEWLLSGRYNFLGMLPLLLLMDPMILSVMYVWCQLNKDQIVSFWFGTQFKAKYLPWVLVLFNMIIRGGGFVELLGIVVGHIYFFLMFSYPQDYGGRQLIRAPSILYHWFPSSQGGVSGFGQPPQRRTDNPNGNANRWNRFPGAGHRLGD